MIMRFGLFGDIETKVKNHIKRGNISAKWMLFYTTPEAVEAICNHLIYHYAYKTFNFTDFLNNFYLKTETYHKISKSKIITKLLDKGYVVKNYTNDVIRLELDWN